MRAYRVHGALVDGHILAGLRRVVLLGLAVTPRCGWVVIVLLQQVSIVLLYHGGMTPRHCSIRDHMYYAADIQK